jgi:hypothetical protein
MSSPSPALPGDGPSSKLDKLDGNARVIGSDKPPAQTSETCKDKPWTFNVQVVSTVDHWPETSVRVDLLEQEEVDKTTEDRLQKPEGVPQPVKGAGPHSYKPSLAAIDRWKFVSAEPSQISLPAFDGKTLKILIKPAPFVKFRIEKHDSSTLITGMKWQLKLPGKDELSSPMNQETLDFPLETGGTCDVLGLSSDDDEIWEITKRPNK